MGLEHALPLDALADVAATARSSGVTRPIFHSDRVGGIYAGQVSVDHRKSHGLYLTPIPVADFMANQVTATRDTLRVLDPAAGAGILLCAVVESLVQRPHHTCHVELVAYEVDPELVKILGEVLRDLQMWAIGHRVEITYEIICRDFVLEHASALRSMGGFFPHLRSEKAFDLVIANPPYFKLNKADPRAQAAAAVVHGQPNIYGLFMAVGAAMLKDGGEFIFITPRSFASGPYFRAFREHFFACIRPQAVHVFGSRRDAFSRDAVLQENVILKGIREDDWPARKGAKLMTISSSQGVRDLETPDQRVVSIDSVLDLKSREKVLRLPVSDAEDELVQIVDSWPGSLKIYGLQISTGPVVPFRATAFVEKVGSVPGSHVPLLWMNHVRSMAVRWPLGRHKPEYIKHVPESQPLLVPNRNYVLLRRFSAKEEERRLVAGPYLARSSQALMVGLENHLNYVYRPGGTLTEDETFGLAALFNSSLLDTYFRTTNGNTQVSATELRTMPLPPREIIVAIGRRARALGGALGDIDALVLELTGTMQVREKAVARG